MPHNRGVHIFQHLVKKGYVTFSKKKWLTWVWPSDGGGGEGGGAGMVGSGWKGCLVNLD